MFKLVVLSVFVAVAAAKPGVFYSSPLVKAAVVEQSHVEVHEPTFAKVGEVVESVPSAVSHQSSTVVHSRANVVSPIVAPAVRTYSAPIVRTVAAHSPLAAAYSVGGPVLKTYSGPVYNTYSATGPVLSAYAATAPFYNTYASGRSFTYAGSPLAYSAHLVHAW